MPRNRFSRGVPYVMSMNDKKNFLHLLEGDADLRDDVETLLSVDLSTMSADEKILALRNFEDSNFAAAQLAQMAKARNDLHREAMRKRGDLNMRDQIALLEETVAAQTEKIVDLEARTRKVRK